MTRRRRRAREGRTAGVVMGVVMAASSMGVAAVDDRFDPGTGVAVVQDRTLHPGAVHPDLTKSRLCGGEFRTKQVRPPTSYTNKVKKLMLSEEGGDLKAPNGRTYTIVGEDLPGSIGDYELDHLISLQIGGHPVDPRNLWMQPWAKKGLRVERGAEEKDKIENELRRRVCKHGMPLAEAQRRIADDWRTALPEDE